MTIYKQAILISKKSKNLLYINTTSQRFARMLTTI